MDEESLSVISKRYLGQGEGFDALRVHIEKYLVDKEGFQKVQSSRPSEKGLLLIQAQTVKSETVSSKLTAKDVEVKEGKGESAFNILIEGKTDDFTVNLGVGKWFTELPLTQVENLPLPEIFFPSYMIAEKLGEIEIAKTILDRISRSIDSLIQARR